MNFQQNNNILEFILYKGVRIRDYKRFISSSCRPYRFNNKSYHSSFQEQTLEANLRAISLFKNKNRLKCISSRRERLIKHSLMATPKRTELFYLPFRSFVSVGDRDL